MQDFEDTGSENNEGEQESCEGSESYAQVDRSQLNALIEALLFVNGLPLTVRRICAITRFSAEEVREALDQIAKRCLDQVSGFALEMVRGGYQFRTRPEFSAAIKALKMSKPRKLSPPALETLAIVAYRQPIVKSDVEAIRGVDAAPTLKTLLERRLIRIVGHQASPGQPALYGTTDGFLDLFGLNSLSELPSLRDMKELEQTPKDQEDADQEDWEGDLSAEGGENADPSSVVSEESFNH